MAARVDRAIVWAFVFGTGLLQLAWLSFLAFPPGRENVFLITADAGVAKGSGLRGLADRVEALGGCLRVVSPAGGGTVLTAELPCAARPAAH
jgi:signal transduction histidine kinase